jgi:hypothetical protein
MATRAKKRTGLNGVDPEKLKEIMEQLHDLTDEMESKSAGYRSKIGKVYDSAAEALGVTKVALTEDFKHQRRERKLEEKARTKMDAKDRESFEKLSQAYGPETPMGLFFAKIAGLIKSENGEPEGAD